MASGEIRFEGAKAWLVGEQGRGFAQMADMVNSSRLSNGMRAAGLMRRAAAEALYVAATVRPSAAPGRHAADAAATGQDHDGRRAGPHDDVPDGRGAAPRRRRRRRRLRAHAVADAADQVPRLPRRAGGHGDAMEVRGGCGYIEDWGDPRIVARRASRLDLGGHQQHRRAGRHPRDPAGRIAAGLAPACPAPAGRYAMARAAARASRGLARPGRRAGGNGGGKGRGSAGAASRHGALSPHGRRRHGLGGGPHRLGPPHAAGPTGAAASPAAPGSLAGRTRRRICRRCSPRNSRRAMSRRSTYSAPRTEASTATHNPTMETET